MRFSPARSTFARSLSVSILLAATMTPSTATGGRFELMSRSLFQKSPRDAVFCGNIAVLASGGAIALIHPEDEAAPPLLVQLEGEPYDLSTIGSVVYAAAMRKGLVAIDLSDPHEPAVKNICDHRTAFLVGVFEEGLIISEMDGTLSCFDTTDPLSPVLEETFPSRTRPVGIAGCGPAAAVAYPKGISVLTRDADGQVAERSFIETDKKIESAAGSAGWVAARFRDGTAACWDISDPGSPGAAQVISPGTKISDIAFEGGRLFLLLASGRIESLPPGEGDLRGGRRLKADYENHRDIPGVDPGIIGRITEKFSGRSSFDDFPGMRFTPGPEGMITFDRGGYFWIYSLIHTAARDDETGAGKQKAMFRRHIEATGFAIDLFVEGGWLYLANGDDGLRTGKVQSDGTVEWAGHFRGEVARDIAIAGNLAVLADGSAGLKTLDVKDPATPVLLGSLDSPFYHSAVVVRDDLAFIAGGLGGAEIIDVSTPEKPRLVWRAEFSEVRGIFAGDGEFYLSDGFEGFRIYDTNDPPELLSVTDTPGWNCDCFASDGTLYLAEGGQGIAIADIGDPEHPVMTGQLSIGSIAREIHLRGKTLFVASHTAGLTAIDISDHSHPRIAARYPTVDDARGVFADDEFVYLASGAGGVYIFRYTDD